MHPLMLTSPRAQASPHIRFASVSAPLPARRRDASHAMPGRSPPFRRMHPLASHVPPTPLRCLRAAGISPLVWDTPPQYKGRYPQIIAYTPLTSSSPRSPRRCARCLRAAGCWPTPPHPPPPHTPSNPGSHPAPSCRSLLHSSHAGLLLLTADMPDTPDAPNQAA